MSVVDHVFLTRFSVIFTHDQPPHDETWLEYRLAFFREATVASMRSQSAPPQAWLVFLHDSAPEWLRAEMGEMKTEGILTPVYVSSPFSTQIAREAIDALALPGENLITTRLDSDDAIGIRFVEKVGAHAAAAIAQGLDEDGLYINATRGLQLDRTGMVFQYDYSSNAFISYVEKRLPGAPPRTVLQDPRHANARNHAPLLALQDEPLWLQAVHGSNIANTVRGGRVRPRAVERSFGIDLDYDHTTPTSVVVRQGIVGHLRRLRRWVSEPWLIKEYALGRRERLAGTRRYSRKR